MEGEADSGMVDMKASMMAEQENWMMTEMLVPCALPCALGS